MANDRSRYERLEARTLLSGNVTASVADGHLLIRGDQRANGIVLEADPLSPSTLILRGDETTRINGQFGPAILEGVTGRVRISLAEGNDSLDLDGVDLAANLRVRTAAGSDRVLLRNTSVEGDVTIDAADGDDEINLLAIDVRGQTRLHSADGDDLVTADASDFAGHFSLAAGQGDDTLYLGNSAFASTRKIKRGPAGADDADRVLRSAITFNTDFDNGANGWSAGFADYFTGREAEHELESGIGPLPDEVGEGNGFKLSGKNLTDDLFMYLAKRLQGNGLKPNQTYQVRFDFTFASNAYNGCGGIGGTPGTSVYLKAGATAKTPRNVSADDEHERTSLDKGDQASEGRDMTNPGHIGVGGPDECQLDGPFLSKRARHIHKFRVKTDAKGRIYAIVGTDSGFEGTTTLHYQRIKVQFLPIAQP